MPYPKFSEIAKKDYYEGEFAKINSLVDHTIVVTQYKKVPSTVIKGTEYVIMQIIMDDKLYVVSTGAKVLMQQLDKYREYLPFETTIRKFGRYYVFK